MGIGIGMFKHDILLAESTQVGSGISFVSVAGEMVGGKRIKGDEDDVAVGAEGPAGDRFPDNGAYSEAEKNETDKHI